MFKNKYWSSEAYNKICQKLKLKPEEKFRLDYLVLESISSPLGSMFNVLVKWKLWRTQPVFEVFSHGVVLNSINIRNLHIFASICSPP